MKRTLLALWAIVVLAGFGFSAGSAQAYFTGDNEWLNNIGSTSASPYAERERRSARNTRATRQRVARTVDDEDRPQIRRRSASTDAAPRAQRRVARSQPALPSLTGGSQSGIASYYWQGQRTASGSRFNPNGLTAAHRTLPFGTRVHVTNHATGRSVTVTINDRGPFTRGRVIDLSRGAAAAVGMTGAGLARVSLSVLGR